jgi:hypothetical protein
MRVVCAQREHKGTSSIKGPSSQSVLSVHDSGILHTVLWDLTYSSTVVALLPSNSAEYYSTGHNSPASTVK